jgi:hypothetical protein
VPSRAISHHSWGAVAIAAEIEAPWPPVGHFAGRSMLVTGGQAPACETLVTRNPWRS